MRRIQRTTPFRRPHDLTPRERQVLQFIWAGLTNREIAARLRISFKTVEAHRAAMMRKVRASNTAELLKTAIEEEILSLKS